MCVYVYVCVCECVYVCVKRRHMWCSHFVPQSARIRTAESFSFKYGRVEASIKLPLGDWLWPGVLLLSGFLL